MKLSFKPQHYKGEKGKDCDVLTVRMRIFVNDEKEAAIEVSPPLSKAVFAEAEKVNASAFISTEGLDAPSKAKVEWETAWKRIEAIAKVLNQQTRLNKKNLSFVINHATHLKLKTRDEFKFILSDPFRKFDATAAVNAALGAPAQQTETDDFEEVEAETVSTPVVNTPVISNPVVQQQSLQPARQSQQLASANAFASLSNLSFNNFDELLQNPELSKLATLAQFAPHFTKGKNNDFTLGFLKFDPKTNFLQFYLEEIKRRKNREVAPISVDHEKECLFIRKLFISFLVKEKLIPKNDLNPHFGFIDMSKSLFERFDKWMMEKEENGGKEYSRSTASAYLGMIRSVVHSAEDEDIINKKFNVFRGKDRFKIPVAPPIDRSLPKEDMEKFLSYSPKLRPNKTGWSEQKSYDFFLMSVIAFGMNMMDLLCLKKKHVKKGSFSFKRAKIEKRGSMAVLVTVVITEPLQILMNRWTHKKENDSEYFFPFMDLTKEEKEQLDNLGDNTEWGETRENGRYRLFNHFLREKVDKFTRKVNTHLQKIAKKRDFTRKDVTAYFARHTFANDAINNGIHPYRIMQAMGQKCFESFMRYSNGVMGKKDMEILTKMMFEKLDSVKAVQDLNEEFVEENINLVDEDLVLPKAA